jgi:hypothetical protein
MRKFYKILTIFVLFMCLGAQADAQQVAIRLGAVNNTITINYTRYAYYAWGNQRFTVKYLTECGAVFSNPTILGGFSIVDAGPAVISGDYSYKTFTFTPQFIWGDFTSFPSNIPYNVLSLDVMVDKSCRFEILEADVPANGGAPVIQGPLIRDISTNYNVGYAENYNANQSVFRPVITAPVTASDDPFTMDLQFHTFRYGLTIPEFDVTNGILTAINSINDSTYTLTISPTINNGTVTVQMRGNSVTTYAGALDPMSSTIGVTTFTRNNNNNNNSCLAEYHLSVGNDGYYTISLISNTNWSGTDAITATGQVTLKVGTSVGQYDKFSVTDLTMLIPGVQWAQNSRYDAPAENPAQDYISFGLTSYGTNQIPYVSGDTVPLFRFKNTGICSGDSVYLMPTSGDGFAWPNSINANVGQQLSVSGHNEPDVPLCVSGVAPCLAEVTFDFKALLQGAYVSTDGLMHDKLRQQSLVPTTEPYTGYTPVRGSTYAPFVHKADGGGEVIASSGVLTNQVMASDNIVDWVVIELRSNIDSSVVSTRSALVQRDGDIRDTLGNDLLVFRKLEQDNYYFTVRHRNHLGLMSALPVPLTNVVNGYDFSNPLIAMLGEDYTIITVQIRPGDPLVFSRYPGVIIDGKRLLWAGNSNADNYIMFQGGGIGEGLDIDNVFDNIFSDPLNANYSYNHVRDGYYPGDNNLDGKVKYQGPANDVDPFIFFNIISRHPDNVNKFVNFYITEGIPRD